MYTAFRKVFATTSKLQNELAKYINEMLIFHYMQPNIEKTINSKHCKMRDPYWINNTSVKSNLYQKSIFSKVNEPITIFNLYTMIQYSVAKTINSRKLSIFCF